MIDTKRHQYPGDLISYPALIDARYKLSLKDVIEFLLMRGLNVSRQTVHDWVCAFGLVIATHLKKKATGPSWLCDEPYMKWGGKWVYVYGAVDEKMDLVDIYVSEKRNNRAARQRYSIERKCSSRVNSNGWDQCFNQIKSLFPGRRHHQVKCLDNMAESSHVSVKQRCRPMRGFKKMKSMNRFLNAFESIYCFFRNIRIHQLRKSPTIVLNNSLNLASYPNLANW